MDGDARSNLCLQMPGLRLAFPTFGPAMWRHRMWRIGSTLHLRSLLLIGHDMSHGEFHRSQRGGWLRAGVLGANDGLISTSSLVIAMVGAGAVTQTILVTGLSGLIAGALSMAAGEYVSVSSQADAENADEKKERGELVNQPEAELLELTGIYEKRGLTRALAEQVARELTAHDALSAHLRDELGIHEVLKARPLQAAVASAASFIVGALPPFFWSQRWNAATWQQRSWPPRCASWPPSVRSRPGLAERRHCAALCG
ncbi:MAG: VIT family protein, partial [Stenotrophomonas geniculata]